MTQAHIIPTYTFSAANKTITFPNLTNPVIEGFQLITNLTTGTIIYQFNDVAKGGSVSSNVLTLTFDTTAMSDTDKLQIIYNPPTGGFFDRALFLFYQMVEHLRAPSWVTKLAGGDKVQVIISTDSNVNVNNINSGTITNVTNLNTIDSRELIWSMWDTEFNVGIRSKIT